MSSAAWNCRHSTSLDVGVLNQRLAGLASEGFCLNCQLFLGDLLLRGCTRGLVEVVVLLVVLGQLLRVLWRIARIVKHLLRFLVVLMDLSYSLLRCLLLLFGCRRRMWNFIQVDQLLFILHT